MPPFRLWLIYEPRRIMCGSWRWNGSNCGVGTGISKVSIPLRNSSTPLTPSTSGANPIYVPLLGTIPPRPPPHPSAIIHLPFPSSPPATAAGLNALLPVIRFLERMVTPGALGCLTSVSPSVGSASGIGVSRTPPKAHTLPSPWSSIPESSESRSGSITPHKPVPGSTGDEYPIDIRKSDLSDATTPAAPAYRPRPLKVLLYSSDGYTESSVPALCLLMAVKGLSLPEAYLEMQVGFCTRS